MLDPAIKTQWLAALRSGQYAQIRLKLHTTEGYCCLGVLCEQLPSWQWETLHKARGEVPTVFGYTTPTGMEVGSALMPELAASIGLDEGHQQQLIAMNDTGKTFAAIADWIEANL